MYSLMFYVQPYVQFNYKQYSMDRPHFPLNKEASLGLGYVGGIRTAQPLVPTKVWEEEANLLMLRSKIFHLAT